MYFVFGENAENCLYAAGMTANDFLAMLIKRRFPQLQRARWSVCVEGFVIMPEHIHLLVRGNAGDVRKFMQYTLAETSRNISQMACQRAKAGDPMAVIWLKTFLGAGKWDGCPQGMEREISVRGARQRVGGNG